MSSRALLCPVQLTRTTSAQHLFGSGLSCFFPPHSVAQTAVVQSHFHTVLGCGVWPWLVVVVTLVCVDPFLVVT